MTHARLATPLRTVLLVGRDLHEAERVRRLLPARVGIARAPSEALAQGCACDVILLEDRQWPVTEAAALEELRKRSAAQKLALILSRLRCQDGETKGVPVVERPYRMDELIDAMR